MQLLPELACSLTVIRMYQGNLYRIHTSEVIFASDVDTKREKIIGSIAMDGSCYVSPITQYSQEVVAFSKNHDFTRDVFYKISSNEKAVLIHSNTKTLYGLDVNALEERFNEVVPRFVEEQEVLFPLLKDYVIKEYQCTPNQFNYYMRHQPK